MFEMEVIVWNIKIIRQVIAENHIGHWHSYSIPCKIIVYQVLLHWMGWFLIVYKIIDSMVTVH